MRISVIGAGNVGGTLARRLAAAGHDLAIANSRGPATLAALAEQIGATARPLLAVAAGADVVVVSLPLGTIPSLPAQALAAISHEAIVVDTGNYVPHLRDRPIPELDAGTVESQWTAAHLNHPVIKAFNTITADHLRTLGRAAGTAGRVALPVAGDDPGAKATVMALVDQVGFDPVDAGSLAESWRQQPGTPGYTTDLDVDGVRHALLHASPAQTTAWRERLASINLSDQR